MMFDAGETNKSASDREDPNKVVKLQNRSFGQFSTPESDDRVPDPVGPIGPSCFGPSIRFHFQISAKFWFVVQILPCSWCFFSFLYLNYILLNL